MKKITLPASALKNLKTSLSDNADETVPVVPEESLADGHKVPVVSEDPSLAELTELKEKFSTSEADKLKLAETVTALEADAVTVKESAASSEKLVTKLSAQLLVTVNSMKIAMGHVELGEDVTGEALLAEYDHTLPKYLESIPPGSAVDEPAVDEPAATKETITTSLSDTADINNYAWGKK